MKRFGIIAVLLGALALSACTQDVVVTNGGSTTNVGRVISEDASITVEGQLNGKFVPLGIYELDGSKFTEQLTEQWKTFDDKQILTGPVVFKFTSRVIYTGTKNLAIAVVDRTLFKCDKGMMMGTCITATQKKEAELYTQYKTKFSHL